MTLVEFKAWFVGFSSAIDYNQGLTRAQWERLVVTIDGIEDPTVIGTPIKQHPPGTVVWDPCKTVPLKQDIPGDMLKPMCETTSASYTPEWKFRGVPTMGEAHEKIAADIMQNMLNER